jgi:cytochrome P450
MKFMDMIIDETLRLYPVAEVVDRNSNKYYEYEDSNNIIKIPENTNITVVIKSLHMDPNIYPEPGVFNPYRFENDDIKKSKDGCYYLPFGNGPRNCVGIRFALIEIKLLLARLIIKYKFLKSNDTQVNKSNYFFYIKIV